MVTIQTKRIPRGEIRAVVVAAARHFLRELMPLRRKDITILIETVPNMLEEQGLHGSCMPEDNEDGNAFFNEFTISLNEDFSSMEDLLTTLAHECVHLRQFARGELRFTSSAFYNKWKGESYDLVTTTYDDLPWEIEAVTLESALCKGWIDTLVDGKLSRKSTLQV